MRGVCRWGAGAERSTGVLVALPAPLTLPGRQELLPPPIGASCVGSTIGTGWRIAPADPSPSSSRTSSPASQGSRALKTHAARSGSGPVLLLWEHPDSPPSSGIQPSVSAIRPTGNGSGRSRHRRTLASRPATRAAMKVSRNHESPSGGRHGWRRGRRMTERADRRRPPALEPRILRLQRRRPKQAGNAGRAGATVVRRPASRSQAPAGSAITRAARLRSHPPPRRARAASSEPGSPAT